jgi:CHAD domain-containing protein
VSPLRAELKWLGGEELGEVRDLDVLLERLRLDAQELDAADRPGAEQVLAGFEERRQAAYERLRAALRSPRCADLLEKTVRVVTAPPFASKRARRKAAGVVPKLVRKPLRRLVRDASRLDDEPSDAALHRIRIDVKRVRYATDLAVPVAGTQARRSARALARVQDVLGDHHDAITALARLRDLALGAPPETALAAGVLGGLQIARAADRRARFPAVFEGATSKRRWRWIDGR